jgi:preprotein translocase subunit YajC
MGKLKIKGKLGKGEKITGKVDDVNDNVVTLEMKDEETKVKVEVPENIAEILDDMYSNEIVTIENTNGEFIIEDHEDWPAEEKSKD